MLKRDGWVGKGASSKSQAFRIPFLLVLQPTL